MSAASPPALTPRIWQVGALCRAIADALEARFNPVAVRGEVSGFSRASSGHCYFSLKDEQGQLRCAMFRRAAGLLNFTPRDGELVEARGRLAIYEPRGDLQMIVEALSPVGQGALFEQFLRIKARLEAEGLFDAARKRKLPLMPRGIGIVTSRAAAALHDVATALQRRVPHLPVVFAPAAVQGAGAPAELIRALRSLSPGALEAAAAPPVDVILLVRGGGSIDDLWAFNDEQLARAIAGSPVPVVSGVGHETDFTIADFVSDLRAPTPTAAAELVSEPREVWLGALELLEDRMRSAMQRLLDTHAQRVDLAASRLGRPSGLMNRQRIMLHSQAHALHYGTQAALREAHARLEGASAALAPATSLCLRRVSDRLEHARLRLQSLDPSLILRRGYAWLADEQGRAVTSAGQTRTGQQLTAVLGDGEVDVSVLTSRAN